MGAEGHKALETAAAVLDGPVVRTSASVIGKRGGESVIVATTSWGFVVTVLLPSPRVAFTVEQRGWLRKTLAVEGEPTELVRELLDAEHLERLAALAPTLVELGLTALRLERKYGAAEDVTAAVVWVVSVAQRVRRLDGQTGRTKLAG